MDVFWVQTITQNVCRGYRSLRGRGSLLPITASLNQHRGTASEARRRMCNRSLRSAPSPSPIHRPPRRIAVAPLFPSRLSCDIKMEMMDRHSIWKWYTGGRGRTALKRVVEAPQQYPSDGNARAVLAPQHPGCRGL